jgi:heme a synthase
MTHSLLSPRTFSSDGQQVKTWVRRLVWKMAIATFLLMGIGSATRVMNAGLACPDWPLCYGQLVPTQQMNLQVFLEWFHRLDAALIGISAIALVGLTLWFRAVLPRWLPWAAGFALFLILFQGILGGLTVTQLLRFDIVTAHLGTALFFFVTLLAIACGLSEFKGNGTAAKLPWLGGIATGLIYGQSLLGGLVASQWAAHQCFFQGDMCLVMNSHMFGVVPATLGTLTTVIVSWRTPALHPVLRYLANTAALLVCLQVAIGVATYKLHLQVEPLTVTHQAVGAALLGTLAMFTFFSLRDRQIVMQLTD